jgi:hypothetical protein
MLTLLTSLMIPPASQPPGVSKLTASCSSSSMFLLFLLLLLLQLLPAEPPTTTVIQSGAVQCSAVGATSCCIKTSHKNKDWSTKTAVALPLQYPPQTGEPVWGREPVWGIQSSPAGTIL